MAKYLLLALVVIWLFYSPALRRRRGSPHKAATQPNAGPSGTPKEHSTQTMVRCAHCGVHLPSSEALLDGQQAPYCSQEHRRAGPRSA